MITKFNITATIPFNTTIVPFVPEGRDDRGISGRMITESQQQPAPGDIKWQPEIPSTYTLPAVSGTYALYAWGDNRYGQCDIPEVLTNGSVKVKLITAGLYRSAAVSHDGTIYAWGNNDQGQCNVPDGLSRVIAIAASGMHTLALKDDGTVIAWGSDKLAGRIRLI